MTREQFDRILSRLSVLKFPPESTDGHWDVLQHETPTDLYTGVTRSLATRAWFPVPRELTDDVIEARIAQMEAAPPDDTMSTPLPEPHTFHLPDGTPIYVTHERPYTCLVCSDSGWSEFWCGEAGPTMKPWDEYRHCGRSGVHVGHRFAVECPCAGTNKVILARKAREAIRRQKREVEATTK